MVFLITVIILSVYGCKKPDCDDRDNPVAKDTFRIATTANGKLSTVILRDEMFNYNYSAGTTTISKFVNGVYTDCTTIIFNSDGRQLMLNRKEPMAQIEQGLFFEYNGNEVSGATCFFSGAADPIIVTYSRMNHNLVSISSGDSAAPLL